MAPDQYRARAAELRARSKIEQDPEVAAMFEIVAASFQQLADTPTLPIEFELPSNQLYPRDPFT